MFKARTNDYENLLRAKERWQVYCNFFTREKNIRDRGENLHRFVFVFFSSTIFSHFGRSRRHMLGANYLFSFYTLIACNAPCKAAGRIVSRSVRACEWLPCLEALVTFLQRSNIYTRFDVFHDLGALKTGLQRRLPRSWNASPCAELVAVDLRQ